ncbi:MAG: hypothetical protein HWD85_00005 [Flavobacteriaceae bacterium]|nr:hypothetical protein [Flavobacteriaceae bacterium]
MTLLLFPLILIIGGYVQITNQTVELYLLFTAYNLSFISILLLILYLYTKIQMKKKLSKSLGLGDVLFFLFLGVSFPTATFLVLFSGSLVFSLLVFLLLKPILKEKTVPLAGLQSLFLTLVLIVNSFFNFVDLYQI